jgi:GDP-mannose transporter
MVCEDMWINYLLNGRSFKQVSPQSARTCRTEVCMRKELTNRLPVAASGILFFGDPANLGNVSAIAVGGVAGVVYAIAKVNQGRIEKARVAREGLQKA